MDDARLWKFAAAALAHSVVRYVEAWGLWNRRAWAEWLALYLRTEIVKVVKRTNAVHVSVRGAAGYLEFSEWRRASMSLRIAARTAFVTSSPFSRVASVASP